MPRFLVDECLGIGVSTYLRSVGYDAVAIQESASGLSCGSADSAVLSHAVLAGRVVVTGDTNFGTLVFRYQLPHVGILLLRVTPDRTDVFIAAIARALAHPPPAWNRCIVVVSNDHIRSTEFPQRPSSPSRDPHA